MIQCYGIDVPHSSRVSASYLKEHQLSSTGCFDSNGNFWSLTKRFSTLTICNDFRFKEEREKKKKKNIFTETS